MNIKSRLQALVLAAALLVLSSNIANAASFGSTLPYNFTLSNTIIDVGQTTFANSVVSGGSNGPYSGQWTWINSNGVNDQVVNTIYVGAHPYGVAFNPSGTVAYVTTENNPGAVNVINVATNTVINTIATGADPYSVAFSPLGSIAYVASFSAGSVNVINIATNTVVNSIAGTQGPLDVAFNPSGTIAYLPSWHIAGTVNVITVGTNTVTNTIWVGSEPEAVAINPQDSLAYVAMYGSGGAIGTVNVISIATNTVTNTIIVGSQPESIAINPQGTLVYVANFNSGTVSVISIATNTVINTITVGGTPQDVAFNPSGTLAYVAGYVSKEVNVIDVATNTVIGTVSGGSGPVGVATNPQGTLVYFTNNGGSGGTTNVIGDLQETAVQSLDSIQVNNGLLQLTINAVSSNTITFTFNGVTYTQSTGSNTIYGAWSLYGFAQDNGTNIYYYGSNTVLLANTVTINPALVAGAPLQSGLSDNWPLQLTAQVSGGTPSYTYQWYSGSSQTCSSDSPIAGATSSTYSAYPTTSEYYCYRVTDSASTPSSQYSSAVYANPPTISNTIIDVGQISVANVLISGGSGGPYSGQWTWVNVNQVNNQVVNTITGGELAQYVTFNPSGTLAYVGEAEGTINVVTVALNATTNTITGSSVSGQPVSIAFNPSGVVAYAAMEGAPSGTFNTISLSSNTFVNTVTMGQDPDGVVLNPSGTLAYVAQEDSPTGTINVINLATNTVVNTIKIGTNPFGIAINPSGTLIYVADFSSGTVSVVSTASNTVVNTINVGVDPRGIIINPQGTLAYVGSSGGSHTVNIINLATNTVANTLITGLDPFSLAFNPSGTLAYVTNEGSGTVSVINVATNTIVNTVTIGSTPYSIAINPLGTLAYVAMRTTAGTVNVIGNLPESAVQSLPNTQSAGGLMQLTVSASSSNSLSFTFNGVTYSESTGSNSVYGQWGLYGFAQDNGTNIYYYGSNTVLFSNAITINPALVANAPVATNSSIFVSGNGGIGSTTLSVSASGGTPPYSYQWYMETPSSSSFSAISGATASNYVYVPSSGNSGTYVFMSNVIDGATTNEVVSSSSVSVSVTNNSGGGGGGPPAGVCGGNSCSTGAGPQPTTVVTTTTMPATTTTAQNQGSSNQTAKFNVTISNQSSETVYDNQSSSSFSITFNGHGSANVGITVQNATANSPQPPANFTKITAVNVTFTNPNAIVNATLKYPCSLPPSSVKPFILKNGAWVPIAMFTDNAAACTISFTIPSDPVVALMQNYSTVATTTQATTTTVATTTVKQYSSGLNYTVVIAVIVIIIAAGIVVYLLKFRKQH